MKIKQHLGFFYWSLALFILLDMLLTMGHFLYFYRYGVIIRFYVMLPFWCNLTSIIGYLIFVAFLIWKGRLATSNLDKAVRKKLRRRWLMGTLSIYLIMTAALYYINNS